MPPPVLTEAEVPEWLTIDMLDGQCPVQGEGTMGAWQWYFRARWESWSIGATNDGSDPVCVSINSEHVFSHEEDYAFSQSPYDAGYMPIETARYYIVRELSRLRTERKITSP